MGSKGKNKAQNRSKNKAKRSGVANAAAAASSAAAAAAAHPPAAIEADHRPEMGLPVAAEPEQPAAARPDADSSAGAHDSPPAPEPAAETAEPRRDVTGEDALADAARAVAEVQTEQSSGVAAEPAPLPPAVEASVRAAAVESEPSEATLAFESVPATSEQAAQRAPQEAVAPDAPQLQYEGSEPAPYSEAVSPRTGSPGEPLPAAAAGPQGSADSASAQLDAEPGIETATEPPAETVTEPAKAAQAEEPRAEDITAGGEARNGSESQKTGAENEQVVDKLEAGELEAAPEVSGPAEPEADAEEAQEARAHAAEEPQATASDAAQDDDTMDEFYQSIAAAGSAARDSTKSIEAAKLITKEALKDIGALADKQPFEPTLPEKQKAPAQTQAAPAATGNDAAATTATTDATAATTATTDATAATEDATVATTNATGAYEPQQVLAEPQDSLGNSQENSSPVDAEQRARPVPQRLESENLEDDEFYRSIFAAGREAQNSASNTRQSHEVTDETELDAELERAQEQEDAFDKVVADRRAREAEVREEQEALETYKEAVSNGAAGAAEDEIEAREAELVAKKEAATAAQLSYELQAEAQAAAIRGSRECDESDFYGALGGPRLKIRGGDRPPSHARAVSDEVAPDEIVPDKVAPDVVVNAGADAGAGAIPNAAVKDPETASLETDDFYRSLSRSDTPHAHRGRLETTDFGEERVNSDFDGTIGKPESIGGGSSSLASSSISINSRLGDDYFSTDHYQSRTPPQPSPAPAALNLDLDDDFLDDGSDDEITEEVTPKESLAQPAAQARNPPDVSLSFLESDDDLLPEDEEEAALDAPATEPATVSTASPASAEPGVTADAGPVPEPQSTAQRVRPKPSMTQFHTDKQGFDLPLEILPQPVKRHAPQRVGSRTGTPRESVSAPSAVPPAAPQPGFSPKQATPFSPPRSVPPQARPPPARAASRSQSTSTASKYKPAGAVVPPAPPAAASPLAPPVIEHNMFVNEGPQHGAYPQASQPARQAPPPGAPGAPPAAQMPPPPGARPIAPRPAPNPDPYGFPGLVPPGPRRVSARASSTGLRGGLTAPAAAAPPAAERPPYAPFQPGVGAPAGPPRPQGAGGANITAPHHAAYPQPPTPGVAGTPTPRSPREMVSPRTSIRPSYAAPPQAAMHPPQPPVAAPPVPAAMPPPSAGVTAPYPAFQQQDPYAANQQFGGPLQPGFTPAPGAPVPGAPVPGAPVPGAPAPPASAPPLVAPPANDTRSRYTPSPLNAPAAPAGPPRGDYAEDQLLKRQRELFVWSSHSWVKITPEAQFGTSSATVQTGDAKSLTILPPSAMAKLPFPLVNTKGVIKNKRKELEKWIDGLEKGGAPGALLYSVLKELLGPEEGRGAGVRQALRSHSVRASRLSAPLVSTAPPQPLSGIIGMLGDGDRAGAMQAALDSRNYAHALIIAHALGGDHWQTALNEFVAEEVRNQDPQLAFVYRALGANDAASGAAALGELKPRGQTALVDLPRVDANLEDWADAAAALYGGGAAATAALTELGRLLVERGRVEEGHTCLILAGVVPGASPHLSMPLVSRNGSPSFDSFAIAEVYEFILGRAIPTLVAPKVAFAGLLADGGYSADAQRIAENAIALAKATKAPPKLAEQAARMAARCSAAAPAQGTWLQRKLSRPNLEKKWVSSFNKFVSGDDDETPELTRPQSAGVATANEAAAPPQSYTPGPYPGRPDSAPGVAGPNGPTGSEFTPAHAHTPLRAAPINEVNEEYTGNGYRPEYAGQDGPPQGYGAYSQYTSPSSHGYGAGAYAASSGGSDIYASRPSSRPVSRPASRSTYLSRPPSAGAHGAAGNPYTPHTATGMVPLSGDSYPAQTAPWAPPGAPPGAPDAVPPAQPATQAAYEQPPPAMPQGPYGQESGPIQSAGWQQPEPFSQAAQPGGRYTPQPPSYAPSSDALQAGGLPPSGPLTAPPAAMGAAAAATAGEPRPEPEPEAAKEPEPEQASEPVKEKEQEKNEDNNEPKKKGWLSWFKKEDSSNAQKPIKVKLGAEAKLIYDKESKRWYKEGDPRPEPRKGPPPPPKVSSATPVQSSSSPAPAAAPPAAPQAPAGPLPSAAGPPAPAAAPAAAPAPKPASAGPPMPTPPASGGIDGILAASASAATARKKRPARSRYVNVTESGMPEGMGQ